MSYSDLNPKQGDSDNTLLSKIASRLGAINTANDSDNSLLHKILQQLVGATGSVKTVVTTTLTLYVDPLLGSDSNVGASAGAGAFKTIQAAINYLSNNIYVAVGASVTIQLADGTYSSASSISLRDFEGGGTVTLQGNNTTPASVDVVCSAASSTIFSATREIAAWTIRGVRLTGTSANTGITVGNNCVVSILNITFGANLGAHILVAPMGQLLVIGNLTIAGGGTYFIRCEQNSCVQFNVALTVTLTGTPAFSVGFIVCNGSSIVTCVASAITWTGSATGQRYNASLNGVINTVGGGANYFPGDVAGATATGGQYA